MTALLIYMAFINAVTAMLYAADKYRARHNLYRIPERVLIGLAVAGGSPAALITMKICHHKTRKAGFYLGIPLIMLVQAALGILIYVKLF